MKKLLAFAVAASLGAAALPASAADIAIVNLNAPGVGFNDTTPVAPLPTNPGVTRGEQALNAFKYAAQIWGAKLDSAAQIRIGASFEPLTCTATTAVLGSAGATSVFRDFPQADYTGTWYSGALTSKLIFEDALAPDAFHIRARFNSSLGTNANCLPTSGWYFGLDTNTPTNRTNLVTVLLHEFAHGLGFQSFTNVSTGALLAGFPDVYSKFYFDNTTGKFRDQMTTDTERRLSAINPRNVVWTGPKVTSLVPTVLGLGAPLMKVNSPAGVAGDYAVGEASFGRPLASGAVTGDLVLATDAANAAGPTTGDACTPITNAAAVAGKIAVVDRGTCGFVVKVKNAQDAGAVAVVVADNVAGGPPAGLGGADPTITIPSVRITLADANTLKAALVSGAVNVTLGVDLSVRAGADRAGRVMLYSPNPVQAGSSISHWDTSAAPNQLMEPAINSDLTLSVDAPQDLTRAQLRDIGWYPDGDLDGAKDDDGDQCLGSDLRKTVVIGAIDTGAPNTLFASGCTISDLYKRCEVDAANHGGYVSCSAQLGNSLSESGFLTKAQRAAIQSAAARNK